MSRNPSYITCGTAGNLNQFKSCLMRFPPKLQSSQCIRVKQTRVEDSGLRAAATKEQTGSKAALERDRELYYKREGK